MFTPEIEIRTEVALRSAAHTLICDGFFVLEAPTLSCGVVDALATILVATGRHVLAEELLGNHLSVSGECDHYQAAVGISPTVSEYVNDLI